MSEPEIVRGRKVYVVPVAWYEALQAAQPMLLRAIEQMEFEAAECDLEGTTTSARRFRQMIEAVRAALLPTQKE